MTPTPSETPLVTIVLVNWNGRQDTLDCLRSLSSIDYPRDRVAVVLVDNGSSDGSVDAVRAGFPGVRIVANETNERFARANNQGIAIARNDGADFVLLLNNDTEVANDFLSRLVEAAASDDRIGMVGAKIYFHSSPDVLWYAGGVVSLWRGLIAHEGIRRRDRGQYDARRDTGYVTACCVLASRACVEAIGGLDDGYFIYGEDADWSQRARAAGFRVVFEPRARLWHKVSSSSGGKDVAGGLTPFKIYHKTRSMFRFFKRHARWYHWTTIPFFMAGSFVRAAVLMAVAGNWAGVRTMVTSLFRKRAKRA